MNEQNSLFDPSAEQRFERFHVKNPAIYRILCERSRELKAKGFKEYSMRTLWEVLRWHSHIEVNSSDGFKLCNDYAPFYARRIMEREPDLAGFFTTRDQGERQHARKAAPSRKRNGQEKSDIGEARQYPD